MTPLTISDHRLFVYAFVPLTGPGQIGVDSAEQLRNIWYALADRLQLRAAAPGRGLPVDPPETGEHEAATLAGRCDPGPALREMWWDQIRDVACVSLTLSRHGTPASDWAGLYEEWSHATAGLDLDGLLGQVEILTALTSSPVCANVTTTAAIAAQLPSSIPIAAGWQTNAALTTDDIGIWQLSPADAEDALRRLAVLAPQTTDTEGGAFGDLMWRPGLSRLARYLLHGARLRYQARVLHSDRDGVHHQRTHVNQTLTDLQPVLSTESDTWDTATLQARRRELTNLQAGNAGLIDTLAQISAMRRTITIAAANMAGLAAGVKSDITELFSNDQRLASDIDLQLDDEATYLQAASQRAHQFIDVIDRALTRRLHDLDQQSQHRQEQFTLFQTAIIGAVLMALTAIQAFNYTIPLAAAAQPAVITALGAIAFLLSTVALRGAATPRDPERAPRTPWLTTLVVAAAGTAAATAAWIITSLLNMPTTWPTTRILIVPTTAAAAFVITAVAAVWGFNRRRRRQQ